MQMYAARADVRRSQCQRDHVDTSVWLIPARELTCWRGGNLAREAVDRHLPHGERMGERVQF
jgi:hypothetical protein